MSNQLAAISRDLEAARETARSIADMVASTTNPEDIRDARQRIRLAREWAKIHGIADQMHRDLLRLEITCLRRIAELDAIDVLPAAHRTAAKFFASIPNDQVEELIDEFARSSSALGVYRAKQKSDEIGHWRGRGREFAEGLFRQESEDATEGAYERYRHDVTGAISRVLDDYASTGTFTIEQMADKVIEVAEDDGYDWRPKVVREGIQEVCRKAARSAKSLTIGGTKAPRFVTCRYREDQGHDEMWVRVPFQNASIDQLGQMVELRERQLDEDQKALDDLRHVYNALSMSCETHDDACGVVAARMALPHEEAA